MTPQQITERLKSHFPDSQVEVVDLTGTEDHYQVTIQSAALAGLSRVKQHQAIMAPLDPELKTGELHALSIIVQPSPTKG